MDMVLDSEIGDAQHVILHDAEHVPSFQLNLFGPAKSCMTDEIPSKGGL